MNFDCPIHFFSGWLCHKKYRTTTSKYFCFFEKEKTKKQFPSRKNNELFKIVVSDVTKNEQIIFYEEKLIENAYLGVFLTTFNVCDEHRNLVHVPPLRIVSAGTRGRIDRQNVNIDIVGCVAIANDVVG